MSGAANFVSCTDRRAWDRFVDESSQGSVFSQSGFLDTLEMPYDLWWLCEGSAPRAGAVVIKDSTGRPADAATGFSLYHGLMLDARHAAAPPHRRAPEGLRLAGQMLDELEQVYDRLSFCLHPRFEDTRPFSWFHYGDPARGRFQAAVWYTGLIDLARWYTFEEYLGSVRPVRRYEYRQALARGLRIDESDDVELLTRLYVLTFARQGTDVSADALRHLDRLARWAVESRTGELLVCRDVDGAALSASLFLHERRCAYYLIGANDPAHRKSGSGTYLLFENLRRCYARGVPQVDVCGVNSPRRGDFKASFNAVPIPYFVMSWEGPADTAMPA